MMLQLEPLHVGISVSDMEESLKWYEDMLGFRLHSRVYHEELKCDMAFIKNNDFFIELFKYDTPLAMSEERTEPDRDLQRIGTKHICFRVPDLKDTVDELKKKQADIVFVKTVDSIPTCFIRDNSRVLIEFMEWHD